jgi:hypothetical protein
VPRTRIHGRFTWPGPLLLQLATVREPPQAVIHSVRKMATLEYRIVSTILRAQASLRCTCVHGVEARMRYAMGLSFRVDCLLILVTCRRLRCHVLRCAWNLGFRRRTDAHARPLLQLSTQSTTSLDASSNREKWVQGAAVTVQRLLFSCNAWVVVDLRQVGLCG